MNTNTLRTVAAAALLAVVSAGAAVAQQPAQQPTPTKAPTAKHQAAPKHTAAAPKKESQRAMMAEAKVKEDSARKVALAQVPGGKVSSHELERENGKLIYSYDIKVPGKSGVEEVHVDAMTGAVISKQHETPAMEKKEAKEAKPKKP